MVSKPLTAGGETVLVPDANYPEGLLWDAQTGSLFYAEMTRDRVMRYVDGRTEEFLMMPDCGPTGIAKAGFRLVIACHLGGYLLVTDADGKPQRRIKQLSNGARLRNPNAVTSDGVGFYASDSGTFSPSAPPTGAIVYWRPGKAPRHLVKGLRYANGLVVDRARNRLLVSEHLARRILAFPILNDGAVGQPQVFADFGNMLAPLREPLAGPDGLALDPEGRLFAALYGVARVVVLDSDGTVIGLFMRPERYTTTVALSTTEPYLFVAGAFDNSKRPYPGQVSKIPLTEMKTRR